MIKNMGAVDRIIRVVLALVVLVLYLTGVISNWLAIVLGILAVIWVLTSIIGFCPAYTLFKISTQKKKKKK
jgi:phosphate/sulfate permease